MDQINTALAALHQFLPADTWNKFVTMIGYASLATQVVPVLLKWGMPAAKRAADTLAGVLLGSPLRPLVLYFSKNIVSFLDSLNDALAAILTTFKNELEADIQAAANPVPPQTPAPVASAPAEEKKP